MQKHLYSPAFSHFYPPVPAATPLLVTLAASGGYFLIPINQVLQPWRLEQLQQGASL